MNNFGTFTKLRPLSLLRHLSSCSENTCLQVSSNSVTWTIYLEHGKIIYATHSIEPFDRLERHLRRLSQQIPSLTNETRVQLRLMFESDLQKSIELDESLDEESITALQVPAEYQAISWLFNQQLVTATQAAVVIQEVVKEVIESFLLIKQGTYEFKNHLYKVTKICKLDVDKLIERCQDKLRSWQSFAPQITSPYQRPYLWMQAKPQQKKLPEPQQILTNWMKGFSLRHLAVIINQDEIQLARSLYPYILSGSILLHEPDPPFDKLPKTFEDLSHPSHIPELVDEPEIATNTSAKEIPSIPVENTVTHRRFARVSSPAKENIEQLTTTNNTNSQSQTATPATANGRRIYKIVSVDDSPTILKEISRFLEDENFFVVTINNPLQAAMSIIRHKPDLILLDLNMAGMDGYELCRIVRNNSMFKDTPIVMVTSNKGLIDKVKARFVGASGYLTKPFTRAELLKMVFMHLT